MVELRTVGPLKVRRVVKAGESGRANATRENDGDKAPLTIVLCHGFGAPGDDLVSLASALDVPAGTVMLFPEAPHDLGELLFQPIYGDARAWWLIDIARFERAIARGEHRDLTGAVPEGLAAAREALSQMLDELVKEPTRLVIGGFSQGAMLAMDLALRQPEREIAGLVLLSGTIVAESEWMPLVSGRKGTPVFQSHGQSDPILPFAIAERLHEALTVAGIDATFDAFDGPHTIPLRTLQRLGSWLRALAV